MTTAASSLSPTWTVAIDQHSEMGIKIDDGCVVALVQTASGQWIRTTHLPMQVGRSDRRASILRCLGRCRVECI